MDENKEANLDTNSLDKLDRTVYSPIQKACLITAILHTMAVLSSIYLYREGDLTNFSIHRLMNFVASHPEIWRLNNLLVAICAISTLYLFLCFLKAVYNQNKVGSIFCLCLAAIAVGIQLNSQTTLLIYFYDCSYRYVLDPLANKNLLSHEGWKVVEQTIAHLFVSSSALYGLAGFKICLMLRKNSPLGQWVGFSGQGLWSLAILICVLTLFSLIPWTILFILIATIAYIIWTVAIYVSIDSSLNKRDPHEDKPDN